MYSINAWLGPSGIEATEAVVVDIILKFLVYLAKNISFASRKAAGYDNIPMYIIKESIQIITGPLAHKSLLWLFLIPNLHILCDNQFGFRKNHSTTLALIYLREKISSAIDRGELAVAVFLDLSKAFDTVNHSTLFDKAEHYGICGLALKWIKSYFFNRLQFVEYNGYVFTRANIMCGVPQGSILGRLFFSTLLQRCNQHVKNITIDIICRWYKRICVSQG